MLKYRTGGGGIGKESKANIVGTTQKTTHLSVIQPMHNKGHRANLEFEPLARDGSSKTLVSGRTNTISFQYHTGLDLRLGRRILFAGASGASA